MNRILLLLLLLLIVTGTPSRAEPSSSPVHFRKITLTDQYYCDGINAGDFNRDGKMDIVAGPFWYAGPDFNPSHAFYPPQPFPPEPSPTDSMFSFVHDFNADGWPDILVLGRVHKHAAYWYENPRGKAGFWPKHFVFERVKGENPPFLDIDGDGRPELIAHWQGHWGLIQPHPADPTAPWRFHPVTAAGEWPQFYHGEGAGDVNGDGRLDLILNEGWWEQPASGAKVKEWRAHPFRFSKDKGGAQMYADDVDGDGDADIITALNAHGWGLAWFEQIRSGGRVTFKEHKIMGDRSEEARYGVAFSQPHALDLADLDGDGLKDIVVGKRRWAHGPKGDVEPNAAPVLYWFQLVREPAGQAHYVPHLIDDQSGVGVQVVAVDVTGDQRPDVLTVSKLGSFVFINEPASATSQPARPPRRGNQAQSNILFTCDFEAPDWFKAWGAKRADSHTALVTKDPERRFEPLDGKALRIRVDQGGHYGLSLEYPFKRQLGYEPEEIYFRYYLRFADDWNPKRGGKLPGISGTYGRAGWGGRPVNGRDGWSARGLFEGQRDGKTPIGYYCYHADMKGRYGSNWVWDRDGLGLLENNRWYCIEQYVRLNTPGQRDGILRGWVDGKLAFEKTDVRMRDVPELKIEAIWINLYHGGKWSAQTADHLYLDNVVIAKAYVGPRRTRK